MGYQQRFAHSWRLVVLLHRSVVGVKLLYRLDVFVMLNAGYEFF
jgi:hypothetical protein